MTISVYSLTSFDWKEVFAKRGLSLLSLDYWLDGLYRNPTKWERHISIKTISSLKEEFNFELPKISKVQISEDGTTKFQMQFDDKLEVETVLIPFSKRFSICLSTQVGCAMNCHFCYTGTQGLKRHLNAGEIIGQYLTAYRWLLSQDSIAIKPSVVFMGQGEPLHNLDEVKKSIDVLTDLKCIGIGKRQITLSTVGFLPGIKELHHFPKINFALSLHSPFHHERTELIPMNQKYPLMDVLNELDKLVLLKRQFITYEYLMIKNFNMTQLHAQALADLLNERKAIVNLIAFNPFPGSKWNRPTEEEIEGFRQMLVEKKLRVMIRTTKGDDILAACGQLKITQMARNYVRG